MAISPLKHATEFKARYLPRDRVALASGNRRMTWREVDDRTERLAAALHRLGVSRGDTCAFLFFNQPEFIETNLAIQTLGAVPVPVNFRYTATELRYVLENSRTRWLLFQAAALPVVEKTAAALSRPLTWICSGRKDLPHPFLSYEELIETSNRRCPKADVAPEDTAVIIYTGGTTGQPKGVMLSYENFRANQEGIFHFLLQLLPPVTALESPAYAHSELERKLLALLSQIASPAASLLDPAARQPPVVVLELETASPHRIPPLTLAVREGKIKIFLGAASSPDLSIRIRTEGDLRQVLELACLSYTWRGRFALIPRLTRLLLSGNLQVQGSPLWRLKMARANFHAPSHRPPQSLALYPPLFHLASYAFWLTFWLYQEGTVFLPGSADFQPDEILDLVEREGIAWLFLVPTLWKRVLEAWQARPKPIESLRVALTGAAPMPGKYKRRILAAFPNALVLDGFGQTEMAPVTTFKVDAEEETVRERSVGRLLAGLEVKIVGEDGEEVPDGQVGELCYRGPTVMKGYFGDEAKTREVLSADGWFRSGDLAYRGPDGEIYTVERKKECINSGGEKIFPQEVEDVLLTHPGIGEACVIGVPDEEWGEAVRAVVVPKAGANLSEREVIDWCRDKIAGYKKPRSVVIASSLPASPVGKILRGQVREIYGRPDTVRGTTPSEGHGPQGQEPE